MAWHAQQLGHVCMHFVMHAVQKQGLVLETGTTYNQLGMFRGYAVNRTGLLNPGFVTASETVIDASLLPDLFIYLLLMLL